MKAARTSRYCCTLIAALLLCAGAAHAADQYPSKPVRLILPFGAGGSTDIVGRVLAQHFSESWGQTLVKIEPASVHRLITASTAYHAWSSGNVTRKSNGV